MRRMGAGTLVGFLALVGVAAAAAGVSSERNVRDLAQFRASASNMRAAYGDVRTGYGVAAPVTSTASSTPSSTPVAAVYLMPSTTATPVEVSIGQGTLLPTATIAKFRIKSDSTYAVTLKNVKVRMESKKINAAAIKAALPNTQQVNACGLLSFELRVASYTDIPFGVKMLTANNQPLAWNFSGARGLESGVVYDVALTASASVTKQQLVQLLEGCSFVPYVLPGDVSVVDYAGKAVKTQVTGGESSAKLTLPSVTIKSPVSSASVVNLEWSSLSPMGAAVTGDDKTIAVLRASNSSSTSMSSVTLKGLPMNLNATFAPIGDRELKVYKQFISPSTLVYTKTLTAKTWRMDDKLGFYTLTAGSPFTAPVEIAAGSSVDFYVTYDVIDAQVNDTLCVAPTRTLSSFISSKVLQFPAGSTSPAIHCLNY